MEALLLEQLNQLEQQLTSALGTPIDVDSALAAPAEDPVATAIIDILADRVGEKPLDEPEMITEGLKRFKNNQPPGFKDEPLAGTLGIRPSAQLATAYQELLATA